MNYMQIVYSSTWLIKWTIFETFKTISPHTHKAMHCYFVYFIIDNMFIINSNSLFHYSFVWFKWAIPLKCQSRKSWITTCQIRIHWDTILQGLYNIGSWYFFYNNLILNNSWNDSKCDRAWFNLTIHSKVSWVHKCTICWCKMSIKRD